MNPIIQEEHFSKRYGGFTGRDYLEYSAALKGMEKARAKKRIEELAHSISL